MDDTSVFPTNIDEKHREKLNVTSQPIYSKICMFFFNLNKTLRPLLYTTTTKVSAHLNRKSRDRM